MPGLILVAIFFILPFLSFSTFAWDRTDDQFLIGYVTSIIERNLHWERNSYILKIVNGMAIITLLKDEPTKREEADAQLRTIDGLRGIAIVVKQKAASGFLGVTSEAEAFPTGDLFQPLIADPKWPQFFVTLNRIKTSEARYTMASVGFGETFGMYKLFGVNEGNGLQFSVAGGIFAQFNMNKPSYDLINADYIIGIPMTYRYGINSFRLRIYHQSSHLGDEFLQSINPAERVNLSYEAIDLLYSLEWRALRVYVGGEYLMHKEPADLKPRSTHWGIEYRSSKPLAWNGRIIVGVDMKSFEEHNWAIDTSSKVGLEFGHPNPGQRRLRLMTEWYKGFDPRGQFYNNKVEYYGIGMSLGF